MNEPRERPLEDGWLPDTPVGDSLLRRFVHNQGRLNAVVAEALGGRAERRPDVFLADAAGPVPYFNQSILTRPVLNTADPVLDEVDAFYAEASGPATVLSIWPTPDLSARGWSLVGHPAFVARSPVPHPTREREGVVVRIAAGAEDLVSAERIAVEGYPLPEAAGQIPGGVLPPALLGTDLVVRIGACDGTDVAVANCHVGEGVNNLCLAATLPAARRRGVWEALVWARIDDAPDLPAVAYTSDFSRPGFLRMGFLPITRFTLWFRPPPAP